MAVPHKSTHKASHSAAWGTQSRYVTRIPALRYRTARCSQCFGTVHAADGDLDPTFSTEPR